ncbi:hypothetical protein DSCW_20360 [Desulfosarcina widdelii]|uniref:Uncharacterized protein n=1 Tax=Desulfosarcina widdelii TaxID=947919 RepID=A0A5K7Z2X8_9BACT|nr:hypothetical protein DSCW_20360 [Desulfosarcina widdelii]
MWTRAIDTISVKDIMPVNAISDLNPSPFASTAFSEEASVKPIDMRKAPSVGSIDRIIWSE